jgi:DNA-binding IclR family transcriptional regulator
MTDLLDWFDNRPYDCATVGLLADETGYSRETVRGNLKHLLAADCADRLHDSTGLYRLRKDPRSDD